MRLTFLGTSSAQPTKTRNVSSLAVTQDNGNVWIIDCGEGTQQQLMRSTVRAQRITRILLTHLHGDHALGTVGLLGTLGLAGHTGQVELIGPHGVRELIKTTLRLTHTTLPYGLSIQELRNQEALPPLDNVQAWAVPIEHRVPCFGYVLRGQPKRGHVDLQAAQKLGVAAGPILGKILRGETVTDATGNTVHAHDVLGPDIPGPHVVVLGDTNNPRAIVELGYGCDVLVHEATYDATLHHKALLYGHSTAAMAGAFAQELCARRLVLTHFSARYSDGTASTRSVDTLVKEARAACPNTQVQAAYDHFELTVTPRTDSPPHN